MKTVVVIPTFNEKDNVGKLVLKILELNKGIDILIIDDNSPDGTGEVCDELSTRYKEVQVIHRPGKLGLGTAYITGFKKVLEEKYDYIIEMDADFSHNPEYLLEFLDKIKEYDLVLGSRYLEGVSVVRWSFFRLCLSLLANQYAKFVTGLKFSDCLGGFRCYRREVLESIDLDNMFSKGYVFQMEILYKAYKKKFRIYEIPIIFVARNKGISKMSKKDVLEVFLKTMVIKFKV